MLSSVIYLLIVRVHFFGKDLIHSVLLSLSYARSMLDAFGCARVISCMIYSRCVISFQKLFVTAVFFLSNICFKNHIAQTKMYTY